MTNALIASLFHHDPAMADSVKEVAEKLNQKLRETGRSLDTTIRVEALAFLTLGFDADEVVTPEGLMNSLAQHLQEMLTASGLDSFLESIEKATLDDVRED